MFFEVTDRVKMELREGFTGFSVELHVDHKSKGQVFWTEEEQVAREFIMGVQQTARCLPKTRFPAVAAG